MEEVRQKRKKEDEENGGAVIEVQRKAKGMSQKLREPKYSMNE